MTRLHCRPSLALSVLALSLAGCAAPSPSAVSRIPSQTDQVTSKDGAFTQAADYTRTKPGCQGECPSLEVKSLVFPGNPLLTEQVDGTLARMAAFDEKQPAYRSIREFEAEYWRTANPRDQVVLSAQTRYRNKALTVVELGAWMYRTGAAHGMSETRFLNWDNQARKVLSLDQVLKPGREQQLDQVLSRAYLDWARNREEAQGDVQAYLRMWPYQPGRNFALTDKGLLFKYNAYEIAPYSSGQPELLLPYSVLHDIVRPEYLPRP